MILVLSLMKPDFVLDRLSSEASLVVMLDTVDAEIASFLRECIRSNVCACGMEHCEDKNTEKDASETPIDNFAPEGWPIHNLNDAAVTCVRLGHVAQ